MKARTRIQVVAAAMVACLSAHAQQEQAGAGSYPNRPIELVVPFPAGGTVDIIGRIIAAQLSKDWGQQMVITNKPGAGGNIGTDQVAKSAPDGYRLVLGTSSTHVVNQYLYSQLPFDPVKDFTPIILLASVPNVLVINEGVKASNVESLVALAKAQPGRMNYASFGEGTSPHLSGALFTQMAKISVVHVPYKGGPPALNDLLAGQVEMMFSNIPVALPFIKSGKLRALAVTSGQRLPELPNVPTMAEAGFPGFKVEQLFALFGPARVPAAIVQKVNSGFNAALKNPTVRTAIEQQGFSVIGGSADELAKVMRDESGKWKDIIKQSGARIE